MSDKTKILFMHNTAMWYRIPFFQKIADMYDLDLVFTHFDVISSIYNESSDHKIKGLEDVNYEIINEKHKQTIAKKAMGDYDVIVAGSWDTLGELIETIIVFTISKLRRKPMLIWREDWDWKKNDNIKEKLLTCIIKFLTRNCSGMIVPGSIHKEYFLKLGVKDENIQIMPNVSNIKGCDENITKSKTHKKIVYVGRLIKRKGVIYLIKAYKQLRCELDDIELIIIGEGDEEKSLKEYIKQNNICDVTFTGKIDNQDLKEYYRDANVVVIPSIDEGMGDPWVFVLNEAMYYSTPVVATDVVGAAYDMIDNNGYIVKQRNSKELHDAIYKIITDNNLEEAMSKRSKEIINTKFQYTNMTDAFKCAVDKVIKKID
ncbi:MAG: glycosyltransferase family 4 protein [Methanosphaera sp.]|uniref:glycosyltransferase family 4 protein n=1 Tax=Methanosphaera sp. TaxID=2666342 RepID=UPI0025F0162A|nr:glycosyltransferase family 4 protein [Methanosphaera sp.]MCI5867706.1 glycosyltransferase family 4 protein [Methanosphaera sp.]MDD6534174.1 glycosyltransferase family 4 protein [Methanosphaera sp.]MDY3956017.1 glycosyltransferase family 4 protein [Methanosphaera sp.]